MGLLSLSLISQKLVGDTFSVHKIRVQELPRRTCTPKTRCRTYTAYSTSGRAGPAYIDSDVVSCRWEQKKVPKNNLPRSNVVSRVSESVFEGFGKV